MNFRFTKYKKNKNENDNFAAIRSKAKYDPILSNNKYFKDFVRQKKFNEMTNNPQKFLSDYSNTKERAVLIATNRARNFFEEMVGVMRSRKDASELSKKYYKISKQMRFELIDQMFDSKLVKKAENIMLYNSSDKPASATTKSTVSTTTTSTGTTPVETTPSEEKTEDIDK